MITCPSRTDESGSSRVVNRGRIGGRRPTLRPQQPTEIMQMVSKAKGLLLMLRGSLTFIHRQSASFSPHRSSQNRAARTVAAAEGNFSLL
jgi:hypothetical protein